MPAYKRNANDVWRYRKLVTLPNGQKVRIHGTPAINTKKAAEDAERAHIERLLNPPKVSAQRRRMSDVFDRFLDEHTSVANNKESEIAAKRSAIERYLKPELGDLYLDEITTERISALSAKLAKTPKSRRGEGTLSAKTRKNILQTLRKCLRWAADMKWIAASDLPKVTMPRVPESPFQYLEDAELEALLKAAESEPLWYAAITVAAYAGLRQGEIRALQWSDINTVTDKIVVQRSRWRNMDGPPKSGKPRTLALRPRVKSALHAIRETKLRGPYVFSRRDGKPFGAEFMNETINRLARKAGLSTTGWHVLRHTFGTMLAMRGANPRTIQEAMGHASITTTMRYMHVQRGAVDAAMALLDDGSAVVKPWRGSELGAEIDSEDGEIIQLNVVTPKGLEPLFSA